MSNSAQFETANGPAIVENQTNPKVRFLGWDLVLITVIAMGAVAVVWRYWQPGIPNLGDMIMGIYRIFLLERDWQYALLYPRIATDLNFGYGAPLFEYYSPLAAMGALLLRLTTGIGFVTASKAMSTVTMIVAGWGAYLFARLLLQNRVAAAVAALVYIFAPYLLLTLYERGAAAELLGLALLPWTLWAYHRLLWQSSGTAVLLAAASTAAIMLAHNITALFVIPLTLIWVWLHAWHRRQWSWLWQAVAATMLGLGLSAFYWLPAMGEIGYVEFRQSVLDEYLSVNRHLKPVGELIQRHALFDYWGDDRFQFAFSTFVLGLLGSIGVIFQRRALRFSLSLLVVAWLAVQLFQLQITLPFWSKVPLIEFIQFPWRLYGVASLAISVLTGGLVCIALPPWERLLVIAGLLILAVGPAVYHADPSLSPLWRQFSDEDVTVKDLYLRGRQGFSLFTDYTPNDLGVASHELSQPRPPAEVPLPPLDTRPSLTILKETPFYLALQAASDTSWRLRLHRVYFPGWQIYADGEPLATEPSAGLGLVQTILPPGEHFVEAKFDQTYVRKVADVISSLALILAGIMLAMSPRGPRWFRGVLALAIIAGIIVTPFTLRTARDRAAHIPVALDTYFGDQLTLLGYDLPIRILQAGTSIPVRLYWWTDATPTVDYKIFIHVTRMDDSGREAQSDEQPILGFSPMTRWEPGELITDQQVIDTDANTPPGRYRLLLGVYDPNTVTNLPASGADIYLPGDRLLITEIEITSNTTGR